MQPTGRMCCHTDFSSHQQRMCAHPSCKDIPSFPCGARCAAICILYNQHVDGKLIDRQVVLLHDERTFVDIPAHAHVSAKAGNCGHHSDSQDSPLAHAIAQKKAADDRHHGQNAFHKDTSQARTLLRTAIGQHTVVCAASSCTLEFSVPCPLSTLVEISAARTNVHFVNKVRRPLQKPRQSAAPSLGKSTKKFE